MRLSEIDERGTPTVVLLQTASSRLEMYVHDKLKSKLHIGPGERYEIAVKADYKRVRQLVGLNPQLGSRWLVIVDLDKQFNKDLVALIKNSTTCTFFCTCSRYKTYKDFMNSIKGLDGVLDFYITYLRRADLLYLHDSFTTKGNALSKRLFDFVAASYSNDVDQIMELMVHLSQGEKFESEGDIREVCGTIGSSIENYVFQLLKPLSGSDKGLRLVIKRRIGVAMQIADGEYNLLYDRLVRCLKAFCQLKMLMMAGKVYKSVDHLPDTFDEKTLVKYQRYIWRLRETPMSELLLLLQKIGKQRWRSEIDFITFIYKYYGAKGRRLLCQ